MMRNRGLLLAGLGMAFATSAFANNNGEVAGKVTFSKDVAPIFQASCVECHRQGDIAPMSLQTYDQARPWAKSIRKNVSERVMPPFHADKGKYEFANDTTLTDAEIATVVAWIDQGTPEGNPADMPPLRAEDPEGWRAGTPDLVLAPQSDYLVGKEVNDEYRCYCLESGLTEDTWINGVEYQGGNRKVVHHIMAYADPSGKAREKDAATPEPGYVCGMSGDQSTLRFDLLLGGWAPGEQPNMMDDGVAKVLPGNADVVFQVHYHNATGEDQVDRSRMGIHFAEKPIQAIGRIMVVGAWQLNIKAGDGNYASEANYTVPADILLGSLMPHMHYIGKDMKVDVTYPDGRNEQLLSVMRYDFAWQTVYEFKEPLTLPKGTQIHMVAHHDNSPENPRNPFSPPRDIRWGEATDEEMSHVWAGYILADERLNITPTPPTLDSASTGGAGE